MAQGVVCATRKPLCSLTDDQPPVLNPYPMRFFVDSG